MPIGQSTSESSLRGQRCRVLRNVWGDIHEADEMIPAGSEVLVRDLRGRTESGDVYVVEYQQQFFRVMRDNLELLP